MAAITSNKVNIAANALSRAVAIIVAYAFTPIYIRYLGVEAYGLVGFSLTLQGVFIMLDLGLGASINREMARRSTIAGDEQNMRNLTRSLEIIYWLVAAVVGLTVFLMAPYIAHKWFNLEKLAPATVEKSVKLMGLWLLFQWPNGFYTGGLMGLHRQVAASSAAAIFGVVRAAGAWLVLWLISSTIQAFFAWQVVASILNTLVLVILLWRYLPASSDPPRFSKPLLQQIWLFAAGMAATGVTTVVLTQLDKALISKMLPLKAMGYYTLGAAVGALVNSITLPVSNAMFPSYSKLVAEKDEKTLIGLYHRSCQLMSVLIIPPTIVIAAFAWQIMYLWQGSSITADNTSFVVTLLTIGNCVNGLMNLPYALQLAYGWTKLVFYINVVCCIVLGPTLYVMIRSFGIAGAAVVWVLINSTHVFVTIHIMHTRLLVHEKQNWYLRDVGQPLIAALVVGAIGRWLLPIHASRILTLAYIALVLIATFSASLAFAPLVRYALPRLSKWHKTSQRNGVSA